MVEVAPDTWLQQFLGKPAFRISVDAEQQSTIENDLKSITCQRAFAYARIPTANTRSVNMLEAAGFRVVDVSITLETAELPPAEVDDAKRVRFARADDAESIEKIAREGFKLSRFHLDSHIGSHVAGEIKECWAANFFKDLRGDFMVVAATRSEPQGFLQLLAGKDGVLTIDLVAVAASQRRKGLAAAMIRFAAHGCPNVKRLRVGTQAANVDSLRLYQRLGFVIRNTDYVLHFHGPAGG